MKILMFGRGVIATQYGWALAKAGNAVEFYVRPGRIAQYGPTVQLDLLDARTKSAGVLVKETWATVLREDLPANHDYELIVVSVSHDKFAEAMAFLSGRVGKATVLVFNNLWVDPGAATASLPAGQVVWGFPGAGGGFAPAGTLRGGMLKQVFFGTLNTDRTPRDEAVRSLFRSAGFSVSEQKDFRAWLWFHFIGNAAMAAQSTKAGGVTALLDSPQEVTGMLRVIRELLPVLKARGIKVGLLSRLPFMLPARPLGWLIQKAAFTPGKMIREVAERAAASPNNKHEFVLYVHDVLAEARKLGVKVPSIEAATTALAAGH